MATTTFADTGLRWALQTLQVRNEVAGVMEEMLATVEHWKLVHDSEGYRSRCQAEQAEVRRLQAALAQLETVQARQAAEHQALKAAAVQVRDEFVANLLTVSQALRAKQQQAEAALGKVPALKKELQQARHALKAAEERPQKAATTTHADAVASATAPPSANGPAAPSTAPPPLPPPSPPTPPHTLFDAVTTLEERMLLRVFSYLSAPDVLATAEVCKPFYDRVGVIFGHQHEEGEAEAEAGGGTPPATTATASSTTSTTPTATTTTKPSTPSSFLQNYSNLLLGGAAADVLSSSLSSLLPPPSSAAATARSLLGGGSAGGGGDGSGNITEKVAASMASKLTGPELKSILAMTERVKKMEALVVQFQAENEDARARLQGAESVKELLVGKLKEAELALKTWSDGAATAARQRASDQEVIGFLDGRVQELELGLGQTATQLAGMQEQARRDKAQAQEQVRVLQDMLSFERQKADGNEAQWRQQKKILAKEVKSLRAEVLLRQKERDAYRDELRNVRLGAGGGMGMPSSRR